MRNIPCMIHIIQQRTNALVLPKLTLSIISVLSDYIDCIFFTVCKSNLPKWDAKCPEWAAQGLCNDTNRKVFMEKYCKHSCKLPCPPGTLTLGDKFHAKLLW